MSRIQIAVLATLLLGTRLLAQHEGHQMAPARPAPAAEAPAPRPPDKVNGVEPIRCWRQASAGAIASGETFTVTLTCAVYDGDNAQVVPDESRLTVASIQMAPFEILGGAHPPDVRRGFRRFLQYDYQLRIINADAIGHDVNIPPLTITYRIHSRVGGSASLEGRDLSYLLPMMPIKVLSLVPADASNIRDASPANLAAVDALRFRASVFRSLVYVFAGLTVVLVVLALVPLARTTTVATATDRNQVGVGAVIAAAVEELSSVQASASGTWTSELSSRALAAVRLVAAAAIGRGISQKPAGGAHVEGRLRAADGLIQRRVAAVASSVTPHDVARASLDEAIPVARRHQLEQLAGAMSACTAATYARDQHADAACFDDAIRLAIALGRELKDEHAWWRRWAQR